MPIPVTPAPTSSAPKTWCSPRAAGGHWYVPVWRSRCRSGTWGWCTRDRGSLLGSGLPCSTRPVRSTPGTGGRSWSTWSTTIPWRRPRYPVATGSPSLSYSGWSGQTSTSSRSFPSPVDAPAGDRLDLGSMQVPAVEGVEVRVHADPDGAIHQVVLVHGDSALQLGVFAAPRSEGIWDEVRADIRKELRNDGAASEEVDGEYGVELRSRVPMGEGSTDIRFVGIDGPRWMVRAVYQGPAAVVPDAAEPLAECLRGLVVDRGTEAMPVREPLPLRLPRDMAEQAQQAQQTQQPAGANGAPVGQGGGQGSGNVRRRPSPRPRRRG